MSQQARWKEQQRAKKCEQRGEHDTDDAEGQRHKPDEWRKHQHQEGKRPRDDQQDAPSYEEEQDFHSHLSAEVNFGGKGA
jgi:hypothetical protein